MKSARTVQNLQQPSRPNKITLAGIKAADQRPSAPCGLADFLVTLDPEEMATIYRALEDRSIRATAIYAVLAERGFAYDAQVLWRHRKKGCRRCESKGLRVSS